eukprot:scaffold15305_cov126-Cylindrotheca_fusiformis.AAC.7
MIPNGRTLYYTLVVALYTGIGAVSQGTPIDLSVLGENSWERFRPGWSLTVNDQCIYEFIFQYEHDDSLPIGADSFQGTCSISSAVTGEDGKPLVRARMSWERFPDYVWATTGFTHMSLDWYPCGIFSGAEEQANVDGYATPQYHFSFYRVTPEFRAQEMTCDLTDKVIIPGDRVCLDIQTDTNYNGMGFNILPATILPIGSADRTTIANLPKEFGYPVQGAARPHMGMRSFDQTAIPFASDQWKDIPLFMSTYGGDLAMFQPHIAYKMVSGSTDQFTSNSKRYSQPTVATLPDTFAVDYDASDGIIRYHMIGKSQLCKEKFEEARSIAGGSPVFPNYDDLRFQQNVTENGLGPAASGESGSRSLLLEIFLVSALIVWFGVLGLTAW